MYTFTHLLKGNSSRWVIYEAHIYCCSDQCSVSNSDLKHTGFRRRSNRLGGHLWATKLWNQTVECLRTIMYSKFFFVGSLQFMIITFGSPDRSERWGVTGRNLRGCLQRPACSWLAELKMGSFVQAHDWSFDESVLHVCSSTSRFTELSGRCLEMEKIFSNI